MKTKKEMALEMAKDVEKEILKKNPSGVFKGKKLSEISFSGLFEFSVLNDGEYFKESVGELFTEKDLQEFKEFVFSMLRKENLI